MTATIKQTEKAIRALDRAWDAMEPLCIDLELDPRDAMCRLRREIRMTSDYLNGLVTNKSSWLWRAQKK